MEIEMHCNPKFLNPPKDINPKTANVEVLIEHLPNITPLMAIHLHSPLPRHPCTPFIHPLVSSHDPLILQQFSGGKNTPALQISVTENSSLVVFHEHWLMNLETLLNAHICDNLLI